MAKDQQIDKSVSALFDAERSVRKLHEELTQRSPEDLLSALEPALREALHLSDEDEASLRLVRIAALLGEQEGARVVDALVDILGSDYPEARRAAGEELQELAFDRFKEVALGVERALKRLPVGSPALAELPYILAEIPEPGVAKLLAQFLENKDPDAVAAAIEASLDAGDPSLAPFLEKLVNDKRVVELADEGGEGASEVSIGELATEALSMMSDGDEAE